MCADHTHTHTHEASGFLCIYVILTHTPYRHSSNGLTAAFTKTKSIHTQTHFFSQHIHHQSFEVAHTQPVHPSHTDIPPLARSHLLCTFISTALTYKLRAHVYVYVCPCVNYTKGEID